MLTHFSYHFHSMSDHILKNIPVLFDLSFETHLFVICMRIISLQNLATKVVVTRKKLTQILFKKHYHARSYIRGPVVLSNRSLTTSTPISADLWCSNSNIKDNHCTVQSQTTPLAVREFVNLQRLSYFWLRYTAIRPLHSKFPTHVYCGIWGIPIWVINPPILVYCEPAISKQ